MQPSWAAPANLYDYILVTAGHFDADIILPRCENIPTVGIPQLENARSENGQSEGSDVTIKVAGIGERETAAESLHAMRRGLQAFRAARDETDSRTAARCKSEP